MELATLFHKRVLRIHLFEEGNSHNAPRIVNVIFVSQEHSMIVVRCSKESEYMEALRQTDIEIGPVPNKGSYADIHGIYTFLKYFNEIAAISKYNNVQGETKK